MDVHMYVWDSGMLSSSLYVHVKCAWWQRNQTWPHPRTTAQ